MTSPRKAVHFFIPLLAGGGFVWVRTVANDHQNALIGGLAAIVVYLVMSWRDGDDEEVADASYFLGFLLTLVLLAGGLWKLSPQLIGPEAAARGTTVDILPFVKDMAVGFILTIAGLSARQLRVLYFGPAGPDQHGRSSVDEQLRNDVMALLAAQRELVASTGQLTRQLDGAQISQTIRQADDALLVTKEALAQLKRTVTNVSTALETSIGRFRDVVDEGSSELTRSAGAMSSTLMAQTEVIGAQVTGILTQVGEHRVRIEQALADSIATATATQRELGADLQRQRAEWQRELEVALQALATMHETLAEQFSKGIRQVGQSSDSFAALSTEVLQTIERMPDPATRLESLWSGIQRLDTLIADNAQRASNELAILGDRAKAAQTGVDELSEGTRAAAANVRSGGAEAAAALRQELRQVDEVLTDFHRVLEGRIKALAVR